MTDKMKGARRRLTVADKRSNIAEQIKRHRAAIATLEQRDAGLVAEAQAQIDALKQQIGT